jgi:hypothetical protein
MKYSILLLTGAFAASLFAAAPDDGLRERIKDHDLAAHWIYDDFPRAQAEAARAGKPLLVLFRCVPCQCAEVLDEQVSAKEASWPSWSRSSSACGWCR